MRRLWTQTVTSQSQRIDKLVEIVNRARVLNSFLDALFKSTLKFRTLLSCKTKKMHKVRMDD